MSSLHVTASFFPIISWRENFCHASPSIVFFSLAAHALNPPNTDTLVLSSLLLNSITDLSWNTSSGGLFQWFSTRAANDFLLNAALANSLAMQISRCFISPDLKRGPAVTPYLGQAIYDHLFYCIFHESMGGVFFTTSNIPRDQAVPILISPSKHSILKAFGRTPSTAAEEPWAP